MRTPNHQWVVIDGGTNKQQAELMADWGVTTIRLAVISHRHFDHNGGMDNVLQDFIVEEFIGNLDDCRLTNLTTPFAIFCKRKAFQVQTLTARSSRWME